MTKSNGKAAQTAEAIAKARVAELETVLQRIAARRPTADRMANAFLLSRREAKEALRV